ncbi:MAG: diaminopimelate decarboxylase, partial [Acidobacteria bacterium]|nr:diaminopimelate decarboxylase [Acidobacteriota bacterium]
MLRDGPGLVEVKLNPFRFRRNKLFCEDVPVSSIAARVGTPFYLYSQTAIEESYREFERAFSGAPHLICYAVKANSNLAILNLLRRLGAGFDIVSGGELRRVLTAGADAGKVVFSGVGKTQGEIDLALREGILQFNVESESELELLSRRAAALRREARIGLRVNPDVDAETHPYHSTGLGVHKFGVPLHEAAGLLQRAARLRNLAVRGIGFHIGSQITRMDPFIDALERVAGLCRELRASGIEIRHLDIGGGLGITYKDEVPPGTAEYGRSLLRLVR